MRLTLRTLLAYLDEILDPEDAQLLQRKIEDSEFATSLVHQIKGSVRQLRLDAPALDAQGIGGDLNSVAEYLDNVLPPEQVPALEKACLENPMSLGEIASCHQILTLVLGEPASFDDNIRHRAYAIAPTVPKTPLPPVVRDADEPPADLDAGSVASEEDPTRQTHPPHSAVRSPSFARRTSSASNETLPASDEVAEPSAEHTDPSTTDSAAAATNALSTKEAWRKEAQESLQTDAAKASSSQQDEQRTVSSPQAGIDSKVEVGVAVPRPSGPYVALPAAGEETPKESDVVTIPATPHELGRTKGSAPVALDRKITWQRSAFFTGLIALLILMGLLFASRPSGEGYFVEWFGRNRFVAESTTDANSTTQTSNNSGNLPNVTNSELGKPLTPEAFTTNKIPSQVTEQQQESTPQTSRWVDPSSGRITDSESVASQIEQPIHPPTSDSTATAATDQANELEASESSNQPNPPAPPQFNTDLASQRPTSFSSKTSEETIPTAETLTPVISITEGEDSTATQVATSDPLPEVAPEVDVNVSRDPATPDLANQAISSVEPTPSGVTEVASITTELPPRQNEVIDVVPDVPRSTTAAEVSKLSRAEMAATNAPVRTDSSASVETPIELPPEEAPINPPVASPTAREITSIPLDARLPTGSSLSETPEPPVTASLPPARLRRGGQLLLALDTSENDWKRIDSTEFLDANTVIQCLPSFRGDIAIGNEATCTLVDATRVQLGPQDSVTLQDGKLLLQLQKAGVSQSIRYRGVLLDVTGNGESSTLAIQASRPHMPGSELTEPPHSLLEVQAIAGTATVRLMGRSFDLGEQQKLILLDSYPPRVMPSSRPPLWATRTSSSPRDSGVVKNWENSIPLGQSIELWLKERSTKRYQRRALAARCLAELGEYGDIVKALGDVEQHAYWEDHFATLRRHLTRGSDWVEKLQLEVQSLHDDDAEVLLELLRGYSQRQLGANGAQKLVGLLRSDKLELRVLALHNLKSITGADLRYAPEATEARRRGPTGYWEKRLKQSDIKYRAAPEIVTYLREFTKP